jgi:hypothetical protein
LKVLGDAVLAKQPHLILQGSAVMNAIGPVSLAEILNRWLIDFKLARWKQQHETRDSVTLMTRIPAG